MARKKELMRQLQWAHVRIAALEEIICPARQHDWCEDHVEECYICRKCGKIRLFERDEY